MYKRARAIGNIYTMTNVRARNYWYLFDDAKRLRTYWYRRTNISSSSMDDKHGVIGMLIAIHHHVNAR